MKNPGLNIHCTSLPDSW